MEMNPGRNDPGEFVDSKPGEATSEEDVESKVLEQVVTFLEENNSFEIITGRPVARGLSQLLHSFFTDHSSRVLPNVKLFDCVPASMVTAVALMLLLIHVLVLRDRWFSSSLKCRNVRGTQRFVRGLKVRLDLRAHP